MQYQFFLSSNHSFPHTPHNRFTLNLRTLHLSILSLLAQTTNSISFLFSLFGTGMVIKRFGLTATLIAFPALMLVCTLLIWLMPNIWVSQ